MAVVFYNNDFDFNFSFNDQKIQLLYVCRADFNETIIPTATHSHSNHLEIQFISDGMANIRIAGQSYLVKKGDIIIYNAGVLHDERAIPSSGMAFFNCGIKNFHLPYLPDSHLLPPDFKPVLHSGIMADTILSIFQLLFEQVSMKKKCSPLVCHHLIHALLTILIHQIPKEKFTPSNKSDSSFLACKAFIDEHFTENISLKELSNIANMSVSGFSHLFKKIFGLSPIQYLIHLRIGLAQKLLISTDKSITEISICLGYDSVSLFNYQFKKFVGTSPQTYRKLWLGNEQFHNLNHIFNSLSEFHS